MSDVTISEQVSALGGRWPSTTAGTTTKGRWTMTVALEACVERGEGEENTLVM